MHDCLTELDADLRALGQGLIIRIGGVIDILRDLAGGFEIDAIYAHEETGDAWSHARDRAVTDYCHSENIRFCESPTNLSLIHI